MPTPLDYERFGMSQDRFARQGEQFDQTMDFRRMAADRTFDYRQEQDAANMAWRQEQAARAERMQLLRMLPQQQRGALLAPRAESSPDRRAREYDESMDRSTAHNYAAGPSWEAERERSDYASQGINLQNYAAQQQMNQMARVQQRGAEIQRPIVEALEQQRMAEQQAGQQKIAFENMTRFGKVYGGQPADLYNSYDPKTGMAEIPGDFVSDSNGGFVQKPGRKVKVDPAHYAAMRQAMGAMGGQGTGQPQSAAAPPAKQLEQRINEIAYDKGWPKAAIRSALEEVKRRGTFTEQDLFALLDRHSEQLVNSQATANQQHWAESARMRGAFDREEARPKFRGMTPIVGL